MPSLRFGSNFSASSVQLLQHQQQQLIHSSIRPQRLLQSSAAAQHNLGSTGTCCSPQTTTKCSLLSAAHLQHKPATLRYCAVHSSSSRNNSSYSSATEAKATTPMNQHTSPLSATSTAAAATLRQVTAAATVSASSDHTHHQQSNSSSTNKTQKPPALTSINKAESRSKPGSSSTSGLIKQSSSSSGTVVNKEPISSSMSPQLYSYLLSHTREPEILAELRKETANMHGSHMQISPEQGQLLSLLVELLGVKSAIEVGVFTGYSSLAVALALPEGGRLVAFDRDEKTMAVAQRYWEKAGVSHKVKGILGPAPDGLQELLNAEGENSFDMAFIDADKRGYQAYFELCLQLVRPGGLIAVDNVLFYGRVADPEAKDKATLALKQFNDNLMRDDRVSFSIVPIGDGMALCRKR